MIDGINGTEVPLSGDKPKSFNIRPPAHDSEVMARIKYDSPNMDMDLKLQKRAQEFETSALFHKLRMFAIKWITRILFLGGITVLPIIFFVIMPFSEIDLDATNRIEWIQNYSTAFLQALGSFGITVLAVIVSELLKLLYKFMRSSRELD